MDLFGLARTPLRHRLMSSHQSPDAPPPSELPPLSELLLSDEDEKELV
jgi:hypothetical protein